MGQLVQNNPGKRRDYLNSYIERDGCWIYTGSINNKGYGTILGRAAHRYFYEHMVGIIPDGLTIDHLCRVTSCVNPIHLEPVTAEENLSRGAQKPGHCRLGHPIPGKDYRVLERGNPAYDCARCDEISAKAAEVADDPNEPTRRFIRLVRTNLIRRNAGLPLYNWQTLPNE